MVLRERVAHDGMPITLREEGGKFYVKRVLLGPPEAYLHGRNYHEKTHGTLEAASADFDVLVGNLCGGR